ncbi:PREDICTED: keratin, type I cytoskeletal 9-like [Diuraphis noxia]|uniref:keratin, type I cytoskeletal 9-like n=1 Tax=Diuraphis noxia TaxID=143948 RepID=UPI00076370FF|nr:PREDICTED: keratin, type I cytoskeletal 9-like [Diuraphis noxia]
MPSNGDQANNPSMDEKRNFGSYVSRSMVMYEDGGGSRGDSSSSGNGGSDLDDDYESWSPDSLSKTGVNGSLSSGSADEGCYSGYGDKSSRTHSGSGNSSSGGGGSSSSGGGGSNSNNGGSGSSDSSGSDGGGSGHRGKWLLSLRTVIDRMVGSERKSRSKKRVVKTILRPPTTYKYVIGMSGIPSKVPVYPKNYMM